MVEETKRMGRNPGSDRDIKQTVQSITVLKPA